MAHAPRAPLGLVALGALLVVIAGCSSESVGPEEMGSIEQAVCDGTTVGDWTGFPAGDGVSSTNQCVHGVGVFYTAKYKVPRLAASYTGNTGNCQGLGACNLWVTPANHPTATLWNRYAWGTEPPQTYDLVIYPPATSALGYGHVASVDHVSGGTLYLMDMNWNSSPDNFRYRKATCAHTIARTPYGFYRLKALEPPKSTPEPPTAVDAGSDAAGDVRDGDVGDGAVATVDARVDGDSPAVDAAPGELDAADSSEPLDVQGASCGVRPSPMRPAPDASIAGGVIALAILGVNRARARRTRSTRR